MKDALSDARNTMVWAISSGVPARLSGTPAIKPFFLSALPVNRFNISVSIGPGATALTRTPNAGASSAADFVSPSTACLLAVYIDAPGAAFDPMVDDRFTILPCSCYSITRSSCFMLCIVHNTFDTMVIVMIVAYNTVIYMTSQSIQYT